MLFVAATTLIERLMSMDLRFSAPDNPRGKHHAAATATGRIGLGLGLHSLVGWSAVDFPGRGSQDPSDQSDLRLNVAMLMRAARIDLRGQQRLVAHADRWG
jgi:hypothetical protein